MSRIDNLVANYRRHVSLPLRPERSLNQRVWFVVYEPAQERRLRLRLQEFQIATQQAGHGWKYVDLTDAFAGWMAGHRYRDSYFKRPELLTEAAAGQFAGSVAAEIKAALHAPDADAGSVVAVGGLASLFGIVRASDVLERVTAEIPPRGRLLVFFPGSYRKGVYWFLDARAGYNYLAIPITAEIEG